MSAGNDNGEVVAKVRIGLRIVKRNEDGSEEVIFERGWVRDKYETKGSDPNVTADAFDTLMNNFINPVSVSGVYQLNVTGYAYDTNNNQYTLTNVSASYSNRTLTLQGSLTPSSNITIASLTWGLAMCLQPQYTPYAPNGVVCPITTSETITSVNASLNANTTYTFILTISLSVPSSF